MRKAGQYTAWNRRMSFPMRWTSAGQYGGVLGVLLGTEPQGRHVVGERVQPDVEDVLLLPREGDAPRDGGAADGEVLQAALHEGPDLVHPALGQDEVGPLGVELQEGLLVLGEAEEVGLLLEARSWGGRSRGTCRPPPGSRGRTPRRTRSRGRGRRPCRRPPRPARRSRMARTPRLWRSCVVRMKSSWVMSSWLPELVVAGHHAVRELLGRDALLGGGLLHLLAVLVGARQEVRGVALEAVVAREEVGADGAVGVPDVRVVVHVVDGRRDVEAGHGTPGRSPSWARERGAGSRERRSLRVLLPAPLLTCSRLSSVMRCGRRTASGLRIGLAGQLSGLLGLLSRYSLPAR